MKKKIDIFTKFSVFIVISSGNENLWLCRQQRERVYIVIALVYLGNEFSGYSRLCR